MFFGRRKAWYRGYSRADIDKVDAIELSMEVAFGEIDAICRMLEEKRDATEKIANSEGIENLCKAMKSSNKRTQGHQYSEDIIKSVEMVLENYIELEKIQEIRSIQGEQERKYEKEIETELGRLIEKLKELGKEDKQ